MAAIRRADASWSGDLASGKGKVSAGSSGVFNQLDVSWARRSEADANGVTSPEELLAAAHASCFAMALSAGLGRAGTPPESLNVTANVTFDRVGDGFKVVSSALRVRGKVPNMDEVGFQKAAEAAKDGCPISQALKGNVELSVDAALEK
jgi:osmotically inducible protein OsmC